VDTRSDGEAIESVLARRIAGERAQRGWSLADLAEGSGVSRSMLSKIEREEASPTTSVLVRIAMAFGITLSELLTAPAALDSRLARAADQPIWTDPGTGYRRRQIYLSAAMPLELAEIELPAGASVAVPAYSYELVRQVVWVLKGSLTISEGERRTRLEIGDRLEFGPPSDVVFGNDSDKPCRYVVAVLRMANKFSA
jgi:transcriptional regulator with XRE-family HTH domain